MALENENDKDASVIDVGADTNVDLLEDEEDQLEEDGGHYRGQGYYIRGSR